jgi:hypothetical protein
MISESGIKLPEGEALEIRDAGDGIYIIENGYAGSFEYFDGRPINIDVKLGDREEPARLENSSAVEVKIV